MSVESILKVVNEWITPSLEKVFEDEAIDKEDVVVKASMYSLLAGGKRIRPVFMYAVADMLHVDKSLILPYATALEMIHTYSLIHDDLPAMDNDDLRRGMPTCHKVYGEGMALLAGDCLLNRAHEILLNETINGLTCAKVSHFISTLAGVKGMIGGQSIDLCSEGKNINIETLIELQQKKTGALLKAAICTSAFFYDGNAEVYDILQRLSEHIGLAFQIKDDILDVESSPELLGKTTGKDERDQKSTFVSLLGLDEAKKYLSDEIAGCYNELDALDKLGFITDDLRSLTSFMVERDH